MPKISNPYHFQKFTTRLIPALALTTTITLIIAITLIAQSPRDYQQGNSIYIMYIHVPAAYNAITAYAIMAVSAITFLIYKHPLAHVITTAAAIPGIGFTTICLISGSLWGKPIWGTWWAWDARMTSVLILFFLYLGYILLSHKKYGENTQKAAAILITIGAINLPIIKFSVEWWNTLHQPASLLKLSGPTLHPSMLIPLLAMIAACQLWLMLLIILNSKTKLNQDKIFRQEKILHQRNK